MFDFKLIEARKGLAFDRGSVRSYDQDGRLRIEITNISKANVCGYYGWEIPDAQALGLEEDVVYQLLRDPKELRKAAATFNGIPILSQHKPVTPDDPAKDLVVGATGTDAVFEAPYLKNSLVIWDREAIEDIESDEKRELSCAYRYTAVKESGVFEGQRYDLRMTDIRGNHVALVPQGRAGADVIVGDAKLQEKNMTGTPLSRKAMLAKGALSVFLSNRIAVDARPNIVKDLNAALIGVASDNWRVRKPTILAALKPKLANDADASGLSDLLDNLDNDEPMDGNVGKDGEEAPGVVKEPGNAMAEAKGVVEDTDPVEEIMGTLRALLEKHLGPKPAMDNPPATPGTPAPPAPAMAATADPLVDPKAGRGPMEEHTTAPPAGKEPIGGSGAMDAAAVAGLVAKGKQEAKAEIRAMVEAEEFVRPYVGKLAIACDSAEGVYKAALETMGVDIKDVHPSAFRAVLAAQPKPGAALRLASDSTVPDGISERFPEINRVRSIG